MGNDVQKDHKYTLASACEEGDLEIVKTMTQNETDDEKSSLKGCDKKELENALFTACRNRELEIVRYLVEEKGVDIHAEGGRALAEACRAEKNQGIIKFLLEKGIDTETPDPGARLDSRVLLRALDALEKKVSSHTNFYSLVHDEKSRLIAVAWAARNNAVAWVPSIAGKKF